jgi:FAD/FMN-containing dehydrogenase
MSVIGGSEGGIIRDWSEVEAGGVTAAGDGDPPPLLSPGLADPTLFAIARGQGSLASGSRGDAVRAIQQALSDLGIADLKPDGGFGAQTAAALKKFQAEEGLAPDGRLGSKTLAALDRRLAAKSGASAPAPTPTEPASPPPEAPADPIAAMLGTPLPPARPVSLTDLPVVPATTLADHAGMVQFTPKTAVRPTSIDDLSRIMRFAQEQGRHVKAIGSMHSASGIQSAGDIAVLPQGLSWVVPPAQVNDGTLKAGVDPNGPAPLVRVGSGTQIRDLNQILWDNYGLALPNMGGYDEQTIAGVVNTATHGSGLEFGPLSDLVQSMDMVLPGGRKVRIEPSNGMTDPAAFKAQHPDMDLIQDDTYFHSAVVSMGTMGVVSSYVLGVREKFYLDEQRTTTTWSALKQDLANGGIYKLNSSNADWADPDTRFPAEHVEFLVNPFATGGDHTVLVTTRKDTLEPTSGAFHPGDHDLVYNILHPDFGRAAIGEGLLNVAGGPISGVSRDVMENLPGLAPGMLDSAITTLKKDKYVERSYNVFNVGAANHVGAFAEEIALPLAGDEYVKALDALMAKAEEYRRKGWVETSPFSLRFVKASSATLAPQQQDSCMVEIIFSKGTSHAREMARGYEDLLAQYGGRPHFGQVNSMNPAKAAAMYGGSLDTFNRVRRALDPAGVMRSAASDAALGPP